MKTSFWHRLFNSPRSAKRAYSASRARRRRRLLSLEPLEGRAMLSLTPELVLDINTNNLGSNPSAMVAIGATTYFTADDGIHGRELWRSDGTAAGTVPFGPSGVSLSLPTDVNGTLYFAGYDGVHGWELWKSDGTDPGTMMVKDIIPGGGDPNLAHFTNVNGTLFFTANDGVHGNELWKSDGTVTGTTMVKDIFPGERTYFVYDDPYSYSGYWVTVPNSSNPASLTNVNGTLFFFTGGAGLWTSDGTEAGTVQVSSVNNIIGSVNGGQRTNVNGTLFFTSYGGPRSSTARWVTGGELWKSDGTAAGTTMVQDIFPGDRPAGYGEYYPNSSYPSALTNVNGTLFFTADSWSGRELWKSDGTDAGTMMVKDIKPGSAGSYPSGLTNVNGTLYFSAKDGINGVELWRSDGTAVGTAMVKDINPGSVGSDSGPITNVNGTLYFSANGGDGHELWKSDGTAAGTVMVQDIFPGDFKWYGRYYPNSSAPANLTNANGTLFFTANDGIHGRELWALSTVPAPSLDVSGFPATTTAGSAGSVTITAKNADETTNTGYLGTVHFTSTDPQAVLPADYTFTAADAGIHTFSVTLKTAGYQWITATDPQAPGMDGTQTNILVKPAAASTMTVGGFPSIKTAGVAGNVTVTLKDPYGNVATGYTGTVRFTSSDPQAILPANYTFTAADAGTHTFSVTLKTTGTRSITVADILNSALTATQGGITVNAGAASQFLVSAPSSVKSGVAFSLTLTVKDAYGNVVTGYTGTVRFTSTDSSATLPANYTFTAADNGVHTFTGLVLRRKGKQTITITDTLNSSLIAIMVKNVLR